MDMRMEILNLICICTFYSLIHTYHIYVNICCFFNITCMLLIKIRFIYYNTRTRHWVCDRTRNKIQAGRILCPSCYIQDKSCLHSCSRSTNKYIKTFIQLNLLNKWINIQGSGFQILFPLLANILSHQKFFFFFNFPTTSYVFLAHGRWPTENIYSVQKKKVYRKGTTDLVSPVV